MIPTTGQRRDSGASWGLDPGGPGHSPAVIARQDPGGVRGCSSLWSWLWRNIWNPLSGGQASDIARGQRRKIEKGKSRNPCAKRCFISLCQGGWSTRPNAVFILSINVCRQQVPGPSGAGREDEEKERKHQRDTNLLLCEFLDPGHGRSAIPSGFRYSGRSRPGFL